MSYPERLLGPDEQIVRAFKPHWLVLASPVFMGVLAIGLSIGASTLLDDPARWIAPLALLTIWVVASIRRILDWLTTQYVVTNERVIFRAGVLSRRGKEIPLEVINDVAFTQSVLERVFRSGDLLIESAGEMGQSRYSNIPDPEGLQSLIYQVRETRMQTVKGTAASFVSELEGLARLRERGVLTDEEFEAQKRKFLDQG
ncbi:MAG: PH domain-containing protein [Acidimicrobiia bacterium]|nr:PH domain-containing protein [Acidimicrobiia bacterium]MDH4308280.1 PH domain-containing protein [Acidimicrobiia bacterium]MDH5294335.1 PH domain-containing protein [Acidimicrobiia bacterium]